MAKRFPLTAWLLGAALLFAAFGGCLNSGSNPDNEPLIRVGDRILTVRDFNQAFEITKADYPHNLRKEPEVFRNAQLRLLNQLVVEMVILERAEELGLSVSDEELNKAVAEIKSDYPEDTFEQTLLESAVVYESWEARLKTRMLIQKVIDSELKDRIVITPEDIARYYERNFKDKIPGAGLDDQTRDINEIIIKHLRWEKSEQAYRVWIDKLKQEYSIEVYSDQWEKISGTKYQQDQDLKLPDSTEEAG
jgi:SurA-like N-terminal domain